MRVYSKYTALICLCSLILVLCACVYCSLDVIITHTCINVYRYYSSGDFEAARITLHRDTGEIVSIYIVSDVCILYVNHSFCSLNTVCILCIIYLVTYVSISVPIYTLIYCISCIYTFYLYMYVYTYTPDCKALQLPPYAWD